MLLHVAHEWGVRPGEVLNWSDVEFTYACVYLKHMTEQQQLRIEQT